MHSDMSVRQARQALVNAQKPARGVSAYSSKVNRPVGRWLAAVAYVLGLSPNQVTLLSGLVSVLAAGALAVFSPSWLLGVGVAFGLLLGFALDSADGQLARLRGSGNRAGEWLDHLVDALVKVLLHSCVAIGWFRFLDRDASLLLALGFQLISLLLFFGGTLAELLLRSDRPEGVEQRPPSRASTLLLLPADFGTLSLIFLLWGAPRAFLVAYVLLLACYAVLLAGLGRKWFRQLVASAPSRGDVAAAA